jgi:hypothetical protein
MLLILFQSTIIWFYKKWIMALETIQLCLSQHTYIKCSTRSSDLPIPKQIPFWNILVWFKYSIFFNNLYKEMCCELAKDVNVMRITLSLVKNVLWTCYKCEYNENNFVPCESVLGILIMVNKFLINLGHPHSIVIKWIPLLKRHD